MSEHTNGNGKNGNSLKIPIAIAVVILGVIIGLVSFVFLNFQAQTYAAITEVKNVNERQDEIDRKTQEQIAMIQASIEAIRGDVKAVQVVVESQNSYFKRAFGLK